MTTPIYPAEQTMPPPPSPWKQVEAEMQQQQQQLQQLQQQRQELMEALQTATAKAKLWEEQIEPLLMELDNAALTATAKVGQTAQQREDLNRVVGLLKTCKLMPEAVKRYERWLNPPEGEHVLRAKHPFGLFAEAFLHFIVNCPRVLMVIGTTPDYSRYFDERWLATQTGEDADEAIGT